MFYLFLLFPKSKTHLRIQSFIIVCLSKYLPNGYKLLIGNLYYHFSKVIKTSLIYELSKHKV